MLRTLAHIFVFLVEGVFLAFALAGVMRKRVVSALTAFWISVPLCALDELHKLAIPGRHCQWNEAGLNLLGALIGIILGILLAEQVKKYHAFHVRQ